MNVYEMIAEVRDRWGKRAVWTINIDEKTPEVTRYKVGYNEVPITLYPRSHVPSNLWTAVHYFHGDSWEQALGRADSKARQLELFEEYKNPYVSY